MPKLVIDGFTVEVESNELNEFCDHLKEKNLNVSEADKWVVKTKEKQKFYDAKEFLKDANYYFNLPVPNLIQTSAKLWLACIYAVKDSFLNIRILPSSHKCMTFLVDFAIIHSSLTPSMIVRLKDGWEYAQKFHQFSYGVTNFNPRKFGSMMNDVQFFAENFPKVEPSIRNELLNALEKKEDISYKNESNETFLGEKKYIKFFEFKNYVF